MAKRVKIREAVDKDLRDIVTVWKRDIETINTASDIVDLFRSFKKYFFVAISTVSNSEDGDSVIGFVGGAIRSGHGHISGIAVDKKYRTQGIGKSLLKKVERDFLANKLEKVTLEVRISNRGAIGFYEKQGYNRSYIVKRYYADGEDAIVYEKKL